MKKFNLLILILIMTLLVFTSCMNNQDTAADTIKPSSSKENNNNETESPDTGNNNTDGFIDKAYGEKNELYGFIKTYLDFKEPSMNGLEQRKSEFSDKVAGLAGGEYALDIPINPLTNLEDLEKEGDSWEGTVLTYNYNISKSGSVYTFKFTHTYTNEITEGSCDVEKGTLQLEVKKPNMVQKYR